ncbi:SAC3 family protein 1 [Termitomyces sp. T112]|nr:SAC3 family protein 1 [Termitomyces sp. T112]
MDSVPYARSRGRGTLQPPSRNRQWVSNENGQRSGSSTPHPSDGERWERGGHRGGYRGRGESRGRGKFSNVSLRVTPVPSPIHVNLASEHPVVDEPEDHQNVEEFKEPEEPVLETTEEREEFWRLLVKAREVERKKAITEGKMDDPAVPKRLEDAITVVGTCMDMCPRFERYRRERENNLFQWETIPGTKRVDHQRAVKMYERAAGDKTLPSDLRPPRVLIKTLDYLFHELLQREGFSATYDFIRDRSRAVRNDFTMQHSYGPEAILCHDRCARFHILALHLERDTPKFSIALEEQQLMNTLQSLKEFYEDQRGRYESPTELEMRVYHRLIHIRDQKERHEEIPQHISLHPVFKLTTEFRSHVQRKSAPIDKTSVLKVDAEGMQIFGELANVLREQGSVVMIYLVACILERHFGKDAIDDIDTIRGDLTISNIIDGVAPFMHDSQELGHDVGEAQEEIEGELVLTEDEPEADKPSQALHANVSGPYPSVFGGLPTTSQPPPPLPATSAFSSIKTTPNPFGDLTFPSSTTSVFGVPVFGKLTTPSQAIASATAPLPNVFGTDNLSFRGPSLTSTLPTATTPTSAPTKSVLVLDGQSKTSVTTSTFPVARDPSSLSSNAVPHEPVLGAPGICNTNTPTPVNVLSSISKETVTHLSLNSLAAPFTPKIPPQSNPPTSFEETFFQKSPIPSPSPLPPNNNAVPVFTPPILSSTPSSSSHSLSSIVASPQVSTRRTSTTAPILFKIDTKTSTVPLGRPLATPIVPPPPPRPQPISLPTTPVDPPSKNILNFIKANIATPTSGSNQEILSPLIVPSPTTLGPSEIPFSRKISSEANSDQLTGLLNGKGKSPTKPEVDKQDSENRSILFARKSLIVKTCLRRWHHHLLERVAWIEACRQSDAYKQKIKYQRESLVHLDKKRRISADFGMVLDLSIKKRVRRVSSEYHPPRTDEELAQRFKENHEEHERRWAKGSFLEVITVHIQSKLSGALPHPSWRIWLSMNSDSDATAIWLERKFNVPVSGDWVSEAVFSIPLTQTTDSDSPGLIIFERTPLEGVADELERKYRILDDCSRLRDIVQAFPPKRRFLPSLLIISWIEEDQNTTATDFTNMVEKLIESETIEGYRTFPITSKTKDLDGKLGEVLNSLSLDVQGKFVKVLTIHGIFKLFELSFTSFISEWIEICAANDFDWHMFGQIVKAAISLINIVAHSVVSLISEQMVYDILPTFNSQVVDNDSAYDRIILWFSTVGSSADNIILNLQSHRNISKDFPSREFFAQLWDFAESQVRVSLKIDSCKKFYLPINEVTAALEAQNAACEPLKAHLGRTSHSNTRHSPRRRSHEADTEADSISSQSKRRRLLSPVDSEHEDKSLNRDLSPSPPVSNVSPTRSEAILTHGIVTVAMLRALTRDVKKRYGVPLSLS